MAETLEKLDNVKFEDALDIAGYGKFNLYIIFMTGMMVGVGGLSTFDIGILLPAAECDLELDTTRKGLLGSAAFIGVIASSLLAGFLADTLGRKYVLLRGIGLNMLTYLGGAMATNFWTLFTLKVVSGFLTSGCMIASYPLLGEYIPHKRRSGAILLANALSSIPALYYSCLGLLLLRDFWVLDLGFMTLVPWRLFFLLCGLPSLLCTLMLLVTPESPKFLLIRGNKAASVKVLQKVASINAGTFPPQDFVVRSISVDADETVPPKRQKGALGVLHNVIDQTIPLFKPPYGRSMVLCMLIYILAFCSANSISIWSPELVNRMVSYKTSHEGTFLMCEMVARPEENRTQFTKHVPMEECETVLDTEIFLPNLVISLVLPTFTVASSFAIEYVDRKLSILILFVGCGLMMLAVEQLPNIIVIILFFIGSQVSGTIACHVLRSINIELFPTYIRAMAISITMICGRAGSVISSHLVSQLIDSNCNVLFRIIGGLYLACAVLPLLLELKKENYKSEKKSEHTKPKPAG